MYRKFAVWGAVKKAALSNSPPSTTVKKFHILKIYYEASVHMRKPSINLSSTSDIIQLSREKENNPKPLWSKRMLSHINKHLYALKTHHKLLFYDG